MREEMEVTTQARSVFVVLLDTLREANGSRGCHAKVAIVVSK